jgi:hypothetical protein
MTTEISNEVKQQIIGDYIKTASGRAKLAASMIQPLRLRRDYSSVARKAFLVEQLPDGALPIYDKDPNVTAFVVGEEGENILETHDLRVARVFCNALDFADMRKWGRDVLDPETQGSLLKTGLMGTLWGAQVIVTRKVAPGYVYVTAEPEFFGRIPVRTELTVLSADDPKARRIGFSVFENLGIGCHNPLALTRVKIAR